MRMNSVTPNFTPRAQKAIASAKKIAKELNNSTVTPAHLLIAILESRQFVINAILENLNIEGSFFSTMLQDAITEDSKKDAPEYGELFKDKIKESLAYASKISHDYVGLEHLFYVCLSSEELKLYFEDLGHNVQKILKSVEGYILSSQAPEKKNKTHTPVSTNETAPKESAIARFSIDYTQLAIDNKLDEVFFKELEVSQISEVLCRKSKNNPILLGDAGVGKTAVIEALAQSIVNGDSVEFLLDKKIFAIDLPAMIAGTKYRGQFEERLKKLINEAAADPRAILFIDEIHTLIGAGNSEGSMDAANILKPFLARGEIRCIGATTFEEYRKTILKDGALDRRFHSILVNEPTRDQAVKILKKVSKTYEDFHGIKYSPGSIECAVDLSKKYIMDKFLPDKAIDLIDQAASRVKIKSFKRPMNIKKIEKTLQKLFSEEERAAGGKKAQLMTKAEKVFDIYKIKLDQWAKDCKDEGAQVTKQDLYDVVSQKTNIPVEKIKKDHGSNAVELRQKLLKCVVGQQEAIDSVNESVMFSLSGLIDSNKPVGSFLFLGSTGLGKTHTAKMIAENLFERDDKLIQLDMSEFSEKTSVARLIGAAPGYVGFEEGAQLIERVKRNPYCVIIFDEIEKAHEDVLSLLLQILEEGKLTGSMGQSADFSSAIIILTSNVGQELYQKTNSVGFMAEESTPKDFKKTILKSAKKHFKLELLNRIDSIIPFNRLELPELRKILNIDIKDFQKQLKKKGVTLKISAQIRVDICNRAEEENMGARPLQRIFRDEVQSVCARKILENTEVKEINFKCNDNISCN